MLEVRNLEKHFNGIKAVHGCDFKVEKNEIVALIGPNGAGKTTVFNIITGMIKADKGEVLFKGKQINGLPSFKIAKKGIARTFQLIKLFPKLTVIENLLIAKNHHSDKFSKLFLNYGLVKKEDSMNREECMRILKLVGLDVKANDYAENLSYGQQKLLEIARALSMDSDLILLDEPVAGVNLIMREKIKGILQSLKDKGKTILFIEHDLEFLYSIADKIVVMDHGEEIAIGTPGEIQKNKKVMEAYLGKEVEVK